MTKAELGEAALKGLFDRRGIRHPLEEIRDDDPEIWREICEEVATNIEQASSDEQPKEDGGPAYPVVAGETSQLFEHYGMSRRDWFAGQALAGLVSMPLAHTQTEHDLAKIAYGYADAMLGVADA